MPPSHDKPHRVVNGIPIHRNPVLFPPGQKNSSVSLVGPITTPYPNAATQAAVATLNSDWPLIVAAINLGSATLTQQTVFITDIVNVIADLSAQCEELRLKVNQLT